MHERDAALFTAAAEEAAIGADQVRAIYYLFAFFSQPLTNTHLSSAIIFQEHCVRLCGRLPFRNVGVARVLQRRRQEAAAGRERRRAQCVRRPEAAARDLHAARELKAAARGGHAVRSQ